jgi:hypothetical protein
LSRVSTPFATDTAASSGRATRLSNTAAPL